MTDRPKMTPEQAQAVTEWLNELNDVIEAAEPYIRADQRERDAQLAERMQARYRACRDEDHRMGFNPADCKAWTHRKPFAALLREQP